MKSPRFQSPLPRSPGHHLTDFLLRHNEAETRCFRLPQHESACERQMLALGRALMITPAPPGLRCSRRSIWKKPAFQNTHSDPVAGDDLPTKVDLGFDKSTRAT